MYSSNVPSGYIPQAQTAPYAYGLQNRQVNYTQNPQQSDRVGGFLFPFLLGGITGGLVAPYVNPRPYYYNNYYYPYPYYGPYYRYY